MKKKGKSGFTLVEIMIVVLIIALLAAIAVPSFVRARDRARTSACLNNLRLIDGAIETWAMAEEIADGVAANAETWEELRGQALPTCPSGGTYIATTLVVGGNPECDEHGTADD